MEINFSVTHRYVLYRYCLEHIPEIIKLAKHVYFKWKSDRRIIRQMWKDIDVWLHSPIIIAQMSFVVEFADYFYLPEMAWSESLGKFGMLYWLVL